MTDEHFMRQWTDGHDRFSVDVDKGLARLRRIIEAAYGEPIQGDDRRRPAEAMLAGLAASAVTTVLFVSTLLVATPGAILA